MVSKDNIHSLSMTITRTEEALGQGAVVIPAPRSEKGSEVTMCWVKWNAVITVESIQYALDLVARD